jgi:yeast amino acid transporter
MEDFVTGYIGIPLYLGMIFAYKFMTKSKPIKPEDADFYTDKDIIDKEEEEFLQQQELRSQSTSKWERIYDKTIGLVF